MSIDSRLASRLNKGLAQLGFIVPFPNVAHFYTCFVYQSVITNCKCVKEIGGNILSLLFWRLKYNDVKECSNICLH